MESTRLRNNNKNNWSNRRKIKLFSQTGREAFPHRELWNVSTDLADKLLSFLVGLLRWISWKMLCINRINLANIISQSYTQMYLRLQQKYPHLRFFSMLEFVLISHLHFLHLPSQPNITLEQNCNKISTSLEMTNASKLTTLLGWNRHPSAKNVSAQISRFSQTFGPELGHSQIIRLLTQFVTAHLNWH